MDQHPALVSGRTAVITGAASGIGLAAAKALVGLGMAVAMVDLPGQKLEAAAKALGETGAHVLRSAPMSPRKARCTQPPPRSVPGFRRLPS